MSKLPTRYPAHPSLRETIHDTLERLRVVVDAKADPDFERRPIVDDFTVGFAEAKKAGGVPVGSWLSPETGRIEPIRLSLAGRVIEKDGKAVRAYTWSELLNMQRGKSLMEWNMVWEMFHKRTAILEGPIWDTEVVLSDELLAFLYHIDLPKAKE